MPIYLYQCDNCGVRFERQQRISDAPLTECPECEGHVRRIILPVGVIFKGSGFYITDNRSVSSPTLKPPKDKDGAAPDKKETPAGETSASTKESPAAKDTTTD